MSPPTNETGFEKRDLALIQLRRAVQLHNQGDFVCSVTLAGAAEEILGRIAQKRAGTTALEGHEHFSSEIAGILGVPPPEKKDVRDAHNRTRNELKHNDDGENAWLKADFEFEAQALIDRAICNYWLAYDTAPTDRVIANYVRFYWS